MFYHFAEPHHFAVGLLESLKKSTQSRVYRLIICDKQGVPLRHCSDDCELMTA